MEQVLAMVVRIPKSAFRSPRSVFLGGGDSNMIYPLKSLFCASRIDLIFGGSLSICKKIDVNYISLLSKIRRIVR